MKTAAAKLYLSTLSLWLRKLSYHKVAALTPAHDISCPLFHPFNFPVTALSKSNFSLSAALRSQSYLCSLILALPSYACCISSWVFLLSGDEKSAGVRTLLNLSPGQTDRQAAHCNKGSYIVTTREGKRQRDRSFPMQHSQLLLPSDHSFVPNCFTCCLLFPYITHFLASLLTLFCVSSPHLSFMCLTHTCRYKQLITAPLHHLCSKLYRRRERKELRVKEVIRCPKITPVAVAWFKWKTLNVSIDLHEG